MSFGPQRKRREGTERTRPTTRNLHANGEAILHQSSPTSSSWCHVGSSYFTPPREWVQEQMRRYAQCIRRRQPPPHEGITVLASCLPYRTTKDRRKALLRSGLGQSLSQPPDVSSHRGTAEVENDNSHNVLQREVSGMRWNKSMDWRTGNDAGISRFPGLPHDAPQKHIPPSGSDFDYRHQQHQRFGDTDECVSDDMDDENITNPYIRSVLRGAEQRWIPPSLAHAPFHCRDRSRSLVEYRTGQASYLSRRDLVREWKRKMRLCLSTEEKGSQQHMTDVDNDMHNELQDVIMASRALNVTKEASCGEEVISEAVRSPVMVLSESHRTIDTAGDCVDCSLEDRREYLHALQSFKTSEWIERNGGLLPSYDVDRSPTAMQVSAEPPPKFSVSCYDDDDDPRAYLYASPENIGSFLMGGQQKTGCAENVLIPDALPVSAPNSKNIATTITSSSPFLLLDLRSVDQVQSSQVVLNSGVKAVETTVSESHLCQEGTSTFSGNLSVGAPFNSGRHETTTNYLVAPKTNMEDAQGVVWIAEMTQLTERS